MEILSKSQNDDPFIHKKYENNNIFTDNHYKYIFNLKMNKIKEEIKDYIIDKYTMKIIQQNKEIINIKNQLEDLTKKYVNIIKLMLDKKNQNLLDNNNKYISSYVSRKLSFSGNKDDVHKNNNKIMKSNKSKIEQFEENKNNNSHYIFNRYNKNNNYKINENKNNNNLNFNTKSNKINYLQKLNEKDLKKLNNIKKEIKKNIHSKISLNKEFHNTYNTYINFNKSLHFMDNTSSLFYNKNTLKQNAKTKYNIKRNKNNEEMIAFNTEGNRLNKERCSIQMNSGIRDQLFKEDKNTYTQFTTSNSTEDLNKLESSNQNTNMNSTSKKKYNNRFFYKFKKINSFNESYKDNSFNHIKTEYICNPIFCSFLNRIEHN